MRAIILNSGTGKRMGQLSDSLHKSMNKLSNGETIFERQIRLLSGCGVEEFIVTTGPHSEQLEAIANQDRFAHLNFVFIHNEKFDSTNYIYSIHLASQYLDDDILLLHGDLVFNRKLVEEVLSDKRGNLAPVHKTLELPKKDFKARVVENRITEVAVTIFDQNCYAFQPFYKLTGQAMSAWGKKIRDFVASGKDHVYAEDALNIILDNLKIEPFYYDNHYIDEVDTLEDLERVSAHIQQFDYDEQNVFSGAASYKHIEDILLSHRARRPMLVHTRSFEKLHIKAYLDSLPVEFVRFSDFKPNPTYEDVLKGVQLFKEENCDFIISVGGGSAIDTAKCIKLFSAMETGKNYLEQDYGYSPVPHIAIPTTAGTGSESTHFSVIYCQGEKQSVAHSCTFPEHVVLDPRLLDTLPEYIKKSAMLDALCQGIESLWSVKSNDKSIGYAEKAVRLILENYPAYLKGDPTASAVVQQAANYSGKAINITQTTAAHAMSYKLTSLYGISHGHAVALCLPSVWQYMLDNPDRCVDPRGPEHLERIFAKLSKVFGVSSGAEAASKFNSIFHSLDLETHTDEYEALCNSVNPERLANSPVEIGFYGIRETYNSVLAERKSYIRNAALKMHKEKVLEAYDWFHDICKANNLSYFITAGSVLGAVRHGGFIPWDDDIDIGMRLPDLDKFRKVSKASLPPGFAWSHPDTNKTHPRFFGKIIYDGHACLDVFPIVKTSGNRLCSKIHHKTIRVLFRTYLRKIRHGKFPQRKKGLQKRFSWCVAKLISFFFSRDQLVRLSEIVMHLYEERKAKRYISIFGRYAHSKELLQKEWVESPPQDVVFEGRQMPVFEGYFQYLHYLYGSYKLMPPPQQRASDHNLKIPLYNIGGAIPPYMQRLHKIQCDMIEEFINICRKYGLQYFSISGTALGAVRHGGFIPWDDDVAFAMPRKDYDTFLRVAPENLSSHLFLQTYNTEPGYQRYFAKIRNSDTAFIEVNAKADGLNRGVFIDVYPLDGFPGNKLKQWQCISKHYVFEACIAFLCNDFESSEIFLRPKFTKKIVARLVGFVMMNTKYRGFDLKKLNIAKEKYFTQFDYRESENVASYGGVYVSKEVLPREYYGEGTKMAFEQFQISVPEKYQDYLSHLYGNYMVVPDEKKRLVNNPKEIVDLDRSYRFYR